MVFFQFSLRATQQSCSFAVRDIKKLPRVLKFYAHKKVSIFVEVQRGFHQHCLPSWLTECFYGLQFAQNKEFSVVFVGERNKLDFLASFWRDHQCGKII
jgi:hypothetical protein